MGKKLILIIFGVLFLVAIVIGVILFLNLNRSSEKPFEFVSKAECIAEEECIKLRYNEDFNCEDFSGLDYTRCMSVYSYFNESLDLCTESKRASDGKMVMVCFAISNYCLDETNENFKFYEGIMDIASINRYLESCGK